eukprot:3411366-Ditylum_brightwellii.AAC.1
MKKGGDAVSGGNTGKSNAGVVDRKRDKTSSQTQNMFEQLVEDYKSCCEHDVLRKLLTVTNTWTKMMIIYNAEYSKEAHSMTVEVLAECTALCAAA